MNQAALCRGVQFCVVSLVERTVVVTHLRDHVLWFLHTVDLHLFCTFAQFCFNSKSLLKIIGGIQQTCFWYNLPEDRNATKKWRRTPGDRAEAWSVWCWACQWDRTDIQRGCCFGNIMVHFSWLLQIWCPPVFCQELSDPVEHCSCFLRLDPRLDLQKHLDNTLDQTASLSLNQQFLKEIWKPQIWMSNSIESKIPNNPDLNLLGGDTFFTLAVGGKVTWEQNLASKSKKIHK